MSDGFETPPKLIFYQLCAYCNIISVKTVKIKLKYLLQTCIL